VVEGYMDAIALDTAGLANVVAPLGTALAGRQAELLWRMADEPVLCFDGDTAGRKAAYRAMDMALPALEAGKSLKFAFMPQGMDPDDLLQNEGPDALRQVIASSVPMIDVLWQRETAAASLTTPERKAALELRINRIVGTINNSSVRAHYQRDMKNRLWKLWQNSRKLPHKGNFAQKSPSGKLREDRSPASSSLLGSTLVKGSVTAVPNREALIIRALLNHPWLIDEFSEEISSLTFRSKVAGRLRNAILIAHASVPDLDKGVLHDYLLGEGFSGALTQVATAITNRCARFAEDDVAKDEVIQGWLQSVALHRKEETLRLELENAELSYSKSNTEENLQHIVDINKHLLDSQAIAIDKINT
jgi:DNA primase